MSDSQKGLYRKYTVTRNGDAIGKHADCNYFVLDWDHDKFTAPAVLAYADACEVEFPALARDLRLMAAGVSRPKTIADQLQADHAALVERVERVREYYRRAQRAGIKVATIDHLLALLDGDEVKP